MINGQSEAAHRTAPGVNPCFGQGWSSRSYNLGSLPKNMAAFSLPTLIATQTHRQRSRLAARGRFIAQFTMAPVTADGWCARRPPGASLVTKKPRRVNAAFFQFGF